MDGAKINTDMKIYSSSINYKDEIERAEAGDVGSMIRVAFSLLHGSRDNLEPEEAERAIRYYKTAVACGNRSAMLDLAACYMDGRGVERDVNESLRLYRMGWDGNDPSSCFCLGCINRYDYLENGDEVPTADPSRIAESVPYFRRGATLGSSDCLYELGTLYLSGRGVRKNEKKGFDLLNKAYHSHDPEVTNSRIPYICLSLAECYLHGIGVRSNIDAALGFFEEFRTIQAWLKKCGFDLPDVLPDKANTILHDILKESY